MEALLNKIEAYGFECEGGLLTNCGDWHALRAQLAAIPAPLAPLEAVPTKPVVRMLTDDDLKEIKGRYVSGYSSWHQLMLDVQHKFAEVNGLTITGEQL